MKTKEEYNWLPYPTLAFRDKVFYSENENEKTEFDVILVCGDAYVDHPAFAAAVIYRRLTALGLKVAVIAQPDIQSDSNFRVFGKPKLFFAIVPGAMDSMVANYTSAKMPRSKDRLSPGGKAGLRPKRALISYFQVIRKLYKGSGIIIGGIEASLRRFTHYDFWEDRLKDPILMDASADFLIYGMGESVFENIVNWYKRGDKSQLPQIPQTCIRVKHGTYKELISDYELLPSVEECKSSKEVFMRLTLITDVSVKPESKILIQEHPKGDIICFPPSKQSFGEEVKIMGELKYNRRAHPIYKEGVPGLEPVQFSVQSHRGCLSACSFCALSLHQGRIIRSRSIESIVSEVKDFVKHPDFKGVIPDIGGPSINMYGWYCSVGGCSKRMCVHPDICPNLRHSLKPLVKLLKTVSNIPGVKKVLLGSGIRYDLIREDEWEDFEYIMKNHISGQLKVAPEHFDKTILHYMRKGENADFGKFAAKFYKSCEKIGKKLFIVPYLMTAFPGSKKGDKVLAGKIKELHLVHEQLQEFTPTPGSMGSAMYYSEMDWRGEKINTVKRQSERDEGRKLIQGKNRVHTGKTKR